MGKLRARGAFLMGDIIETSPGDDQCADSESADGLESPSPPGKPNLIKRMCRKWTKKRQVEAHMWRFYRGRIPCQLNGSGHASCQGLGRRIAEGRHFGRWLRPREENWGNGVPLARSILDSWGEGTKDREGSGLARRLSYVVKHRVRRAFLSGRVVNAGLLFLTPCSTEAVSLLLSLSPCTVSAGLSLLWNPRRATAPAPFPSPHPPLFFEDASLRVYFRVRVEYPSGDKLGVAAKRDLRNRDVQRSTILRVLCETWPG